MQKISDWDRKIIDRTKKERAIYIATYDYVFSGRHGIMNHMQKIDKLTVLKQKIADCNRTLRLLTPPGSYY